MKYFQFYDAQHLRSLTRVRRYETKLGERLRTLGTRAAEPGAGPNWKSSLSADPARYVLLGIPEDIGVKGNGGVGGAGSAWRAFLEAFLNVQSTDILSGEDILLLGAFDFSEVSDTIEQNARDTEEGLQAYRHAVSGVVDEEVEELIKHITAAGKVPLVIGGGHNNAYPLLKGAAKGWKQAGKIDIARINAINLDAHADFRIEEGRHSGNGFRYAMTEGFLDKYAVMGLQENYNSQSMMDDLYQETRIHYTTYEDVFLRGTLSFEQAVRLAMDFTGGLLTGIELDLDVVEQALSSAQTPCGITPLQARQYLWQTGSELSAAYLHIAEGAARTDDGRQSSTMGKLIGYLVADFVKASVRVHLKS
jgi:formiminoglutamase